MPRRDVRRGQAPLGSDLLPFDLPERRLLVAPAGSGDPRDPAAVLLAGALAVDDGAVILDLNSGAGLVGAVAAARAPTGRVRLAAATILDQAATEQTMAANALTTTTVYLSDGAAALPAAPADTALVRLPIGARPGRQLIWDAFGALVPGGRLYLAGGGDEGIRPALRDAAALFGNLTTLAYGKGHRIAVAIRPAVPPLRLAAFDDPLLDHATFHTCTVVLRDTTFTIHTRPGVFAWEALDAGTAALIETMAIAPGDRILDLGCGSGIAGAVAARLAGPRGAATLVDISAGALRSAASTLAANGIANAVVTASDDTAAIASERFDVVVTNPPFHAGRAVAYATTARFIAGAAAVLRPGGRLFLVANRFLPYEPEIARVFGNVAVAWSDARYKVLTAQAVAGPAERPANHPVARPRIRQRRQA